MVGFYRVIYVNSGTYEMGGQGGQLPTEVLADQLTLCQSKGVDCAPTLPFVHPSLGNFLRP